MCALRVREGVCCGGTEGGSRTGLGGQPVAARCELHRLGHVLVEVVYVFERQSRRVGGDADGVEEGEVLDGLAQADAPGVGTYVDFCVGS